VVPPTFEDDARCDHCTVTNSPTFPMDFAIHLAGAAESWNPEGLAPSVMPGQTAVLRAPFVRPD